MISWPRKRRSTSARSTTGSPRRISPPGVGLDTGLPALSDPRKRVDGEPDYGLRHLAEHLERADRVDDLHRLLRLERRPGWVKRMVVAVQTSTLAGRLFPQRWAGVMRSATALAENIWYSVHEQAGQTGRYMNDLACRGWYKSPIDRTSGRRRQATDFGLSIRYALMSASLNSKARAIRRR